LREQLKRGVSIFSCNYAAVISTEKVFLGVIDDSPVYTWVNPLPEVPLGKRGVNGSTTDSFLNAYTFIKAWDTLMNSGQIWPFDFVAKVDPDAVFVPTRLREHVEAYVGKAVYFTNCGKWGGKALLYGSLEVFSTQALHRYWSRADVCKSMHWHAWGEDYYMQKCMDEREVESVFDSLQVADKRCVDAPCSDYTKVAFHDYKNPRDWLNCYHISVGKIQIMTELVPRK